MSENSGSGTATCLRCGSQFPGGGRFCPVCGQPLDAPAPTPPAVPVLPPAAPIAQSTLSAPDYPRLRDANNRQRTPKGRLMATPGAGVRFPAIPPAMATPSPVLAATGCPSSWGLP
jgi:hypothetical protein